MRMGRPKAELPWGRRTMLEAVISALQPACAHIVVVAHAGQPLPPLPGGVHRVDDPVELDDQGPLVGVYAGLGALEADDLVYLSATDKPGLTPEHVRWILDRMESKAVDAVVPVESAGSTRRHRMHPLAGALRVGPAREVIGPAIASGERALKRAFELLRCDEVPLTELPDLTVLGDYNTPEDYRAALEKTDHDHDHEHD